MDINLFRYIHKQESYHLELVQPENQSGQSWKVLKIQESPGGRPSLGDNFAENHNGTF